MSKISELKLENKTSFPSSHDSFKENIIFSNSKANPILIDSDRKNIDYIDECPIKNKYKSRHFNNTNYENRSIDNEFKLNGNVLPVLATKKTFEEGKFSKTHYKNGKQTVKSLQKKLNELNIEINKLRNDSNVQNYNILQLNYKQKSKELTELKQENNFIRFQLEDLLRKNNSKNVKNNNFINNGTKKKSANKIAHFRDNHIKIFAKELETEENNKDKCYEEDLKIIDYVKKNEELKNKNEIIKKRFGKI